MKPHISFLVAAGVVALLTVMIIVGVRGGKDKTETGSLSSQPIKLVLVDGNDVSRSAEEICKGGKQWHLRLFAQLDPDTWLVLCRLSSENTTEIYMLKGMPQPDQLDKEEFKSILSFDKTWGTRPLKFLEYALALAKQYPNKLFAISFFTDGQNDFFADNQLLPQVCLNLVKQSNVVRIGLFGLDPIKKSEMADWNGWFAGSDKAIVCTRALSSTEQGIDRFCEEVSQEMRKIEQQQPRKAGK